MPSRPWREQYEIRHDRTQDISIYSPVKYWGTVFALRVKTDPIKICTYVFTPVTGGVDITWEHGGVNYARKMRPTIESNIRKHYGRNVLVHKGRKVKHAVPTPAASR